MSEVFVLATIMILHERDLEPTIAEISDITGVAVTTVSRPVSKLMDAGLVTQEIDKDDRRRRMVKATGKGIEQRQAFLTFFKEMSERVTELAVPAPPRNQVGLKTIEEFIHRARELRKAYENSPEIG